MCRLKAFSRDLNKLGYAASLFCLEGMYKMSSNIFYGYVESPCVQCVQVDLLVGEYERCMTSWGRTEHCMFLLVECVIEQCVMLVLVYSLSL